VYAGVSRRPNVTRAGPKMTSRCAGYTDHQGPSSFRFPVSFPFHSNHTLHCCASHSNIFARCICASIRLLLQTIRQMLHYLYMSSMQPIGRPLCTPRTLLAAAVAPMLGETRVDRSKDGRRDEVEEYGRSLLGLWMTAEIMCPGSVFRRGVLGEGQCREWIVCISDR
jgi:hypothetical protein